MAPYRTGDEVPRFVCIVCYANASTIAGTCPRCSAPMQPIEGESLDELRRRAKAKTARPEQRKFALITVAAFACAIALQATLLVLHVYDVDPHQAGGASGRYGAGAELLLYLLLTWAVFAGVWTYVVKWLRWFPTPDFDVEHADAAMLVEFLGMKVQS